MKKNMKKWLSAGVLLLATVSTVTVSAATYRSGNKWVKNTEHYALYYLGEAYSASRGGGAKVAYYRNGRYVGGASAYVDSFRPAGTTAYNSFKVWDSMNPWAAKTQFHWGWL